MGAKHAMGRRRELVGGKGRRRRRERDREREREREEC
jgi:hypothetical protein